uniref:Uncharacterized protein n=1 Tax=Arundo donax TaxID=35708 RepID=A0A0A9ACK5_ARUDO
MCDATNMVITHQVMLVRCSSKPQESVPNPQLIIAALPTAT